MPKMRLIKGTYTHSGAPIQHVTVGKVYEVQVIDGNAHFTDDRGTNGRYINLSCFESVAEPVQKLDDGNSDQPQRIPFNIERALAGDPVVRRDGVKVSEVLRFKGGNILKPVVSLSENGGFFLHSENGKLFGDSVDQRDLFMAPKTKTVWVQLFYRTDIGQVVAHGDTLLDITSDDAKLFKYLKSIQVEVPA